MPERREGTRVWSSEWVDGGTGKAVLCSLALGRKGRIGRSSKAGQLGRKKSRRRWKKTRIS